MLVYRKMQSAHMPELHRWISKLTAYSPPGDLLITMVKETVKKGRRCGLRAEELREDRGQAAH